MIVVMEEMPCPNANHVPAAPEQGSKDLNHSILSLPFFLHSNSPFSIHHVMKSPTTTTTPAHRRLSAHRTRGAPALSREVDGRGRRRGRGRILVLWGAVDEQVRLLGFAVQGAREAEREVVAQVGVCEEGAAAAGDGDGEGGLCLGRHFFGSFFLSFRLWMDDFLFWKMEGSRDAGGGSAVLCISMRTLRSRLCCGYREDSGVGRGDSRGERDWFMLAARRRGVSMMIIIARTVLTGMHVPVDGKQRRISLRKGVGGFAGDETRRGDCPVLW
jgi:hypothetical protein